MHPPREVWAAPRAGGRAGAERFLWLLGEALGALLNTLSQGQILARHTGDAFQSLLKPNRREASGKSLLSPRTSSWGLPFSCQTNYGVESPNLQGCFPLEFWKFDLKGGLAPSYGCGHFLWDRGPIQRKCRWCGL